MKEVEKFFDEVKKMAEEEGFDDEFVMVGNRKDGGHQLLRIWNEETPKSKFIEMFDDLYELLVSKNKED